MQLFFRRAKRLFTSASWALLLVFPAVLSALLAIWTKSTGAQFGVPTWLLWAGGVASVLLLIQAWAEYQRRTYDLTWAFKFDDRFNSDDMQILRARAATCIEKNIDDLARTDVELADIDEVLDFFDELGFCEQGGQISPEVLHQDFHYWIKGYCSAAHPYIRAWRKKDPPRWEYVESLNGIVHAVAKRRRDKEGPLLGATDIQEFLSYEKSLANQPKRP